MIPTMQNTQDRRDLKRTTICSFYESTVAPRRLFQTSPVLSISPHPCNWRKLTADS